MNKNMKHWEWVPNVYGECYNYSLGLLLSQQDVEDLYLIIDEAWF